MNPIPIDPGDVSAHAGRFYRSAASSSSASVWLLVLCFAVFVFQVVQALPRARCGAEIGVSCDPGLCCSGAGYCGTTEEYCSVPGNCQPEYGWCDSHITPNGLDVAAGGPRKYLPILPAKIDKCTVPKTLALTFDDGPSNYTDALLKVLSKHKARATFFVTGVNNGHGQLDIRWSNTVVRMIMEGHQVGSHTWSHPNLDSLSSDARKMEMYKTERSITNIIGKMPTFMRPPMVICGDACMRDMKELAYHVVGWEVDSQDWHEPQPSVQETTTRLVDEMKHRDNMFLIQHDTSQATIDIVDNLLAQMPSDWKAVPLVECLGHSLDHAFQFPKWLEYNGVASEGCLIAGPEHCIYSKPFHDQKRCIKMANMMKTAAEWCPYFASDWSVEISHAMTDHCYQTSRFADQTMDFCKQCQGDGCNSELLKYQLW